MAKPTKCPGCGRERVEMTRKGYLRPHVKPDGRPCMSVLPAHPALVERRAEIERAENDRAARKNRRGRA